MKCSYFLVIIFLIFHIISQDVVSEQLISTTNTTSNDSASVNAVSANVSESLKINKRDINSSNENINNSQISVIPIEEETKNISNITTASQHSNNVSITKMVVDLQNENFGLKIPKVPISVPRNVTLKNVPQKFKPKSIASQMGNLHSENVAAAQVSQVPVIVIQDNATILNENGTTRKQNASASSTATEVDLRSPNIGKEITNTANNSSKPINLKNSKISKNFVHPRSNSSKPPAINSIDAKNTAKLKNENVSSCANVSSVPGDSRTLYIEEKNENITTPLVNNVNGSSANSTKTKSLTTIIDSDDSSVLLGVVVISRYGDRSPIKSFPTDKYFDKKYWPMGFGELTEKGKARMYEVGKWLRTRYGNFLSEKYHPDELYAYSSDYNRCLMSASAILAGLYRPRDNPLGSEHLIWEPVPIHSEKNNNDDIFTQLRTCYKYDDVYSENLMIKNNMMEKKYKAFFRTLGKNIGVRKVDLAEIALVRSVLISYRNFNTSYLPTWANNATDQKLMDYITGVKFSVPTSTPLLTRLRVGPFYDYIFKFFEKFISRPKNARPKFLLMSTQDITMASILDGMDCYKNKPIEFGDTIIWELKKSEGNYVFNLLYKTEDELQQLKCCTNCPYRKFKRDLSSVTYDIARWSKECVWRWS